MIPLRDLAKDLGYRLRDFRDALSAVGITPMILKESGKRVEYLAEDDAEAAYALIQAQVQPKARDLKVGWFYIVRLLPKVAPQRVKFGFTSNPTKRLKDHHITCPNAEYVAKWPCRRRWEKTVIDLVSQGCQPLTGEQYEVPDLRAVRHQAEAFFSLMPRVDLGV